jgi:hypothetical protein
MRSNIRRILPIAALLVLALGGVVFAQLRSGLYRSANANSLPQRAAGEFAPDGKYDAGAFPSFTPELAEGEGKLETQSFCAICHSTRYITMQPPLETTEWEAEVNKMIKTYGAPVPEATSKKIVSYLQAHYTPGNRKE